jgi:spore coat polysaccharide biosynthesis predicted glycosyltransferase SpsG
MLYYYAYSGHKVGLDRVRRAAALLKKFQNEGMETRLLVNDFRAGLAAREFGILDSVTIETVQDIDAIAQIGDVVIIDSHEDDRGRLQKYCSEYKAVFRFAQDEQDVVRFDEIMIKTPCEDDSCIDALIIDDAYFEETPKEERILFFLGDTDHDKTILNNERFFKAFDMELLLGHYFFVKYEDDLAELFSTLYEPEEYMDLIKSSSHIVTASAQTALEAKASGAKVVYLNISKNDLYPLEFLKTYGINVVDDFDVEEVAKYLEEEQASQKKIECFDVHKIKSVLKLL